MSATQKLVTDAVSQRQRLLGERKKEKSKLNDWANAKDELTREINRVANKNPRSYLRKGTHPEGPIDDFSSLIYDSSKIATDAFNDNDPYVYARNGFPRITQLLEILKLLDPGMEDGRITGWGMGAVAATLWGLSPSDHIVASKNLFGGCRVALTKMQKWGIEVDFIDGTNPENWEKAIKPNTKMFWFETPGNPTLEIVDIKKVVEIAHRERQDGPRILVGADLSLAYGAHKPLLMGIDISFSSLTKAFGFGKNGAGVFAMSKLGMEIHREQIGEPANSNKNLFFEQVPEWGLTAVGGTLLRGLINNARHLPGRFAQQVGTATALAGRLKALSKELSISVIHATHPQMQPGTSVFSIDFGEDERRAAVFISELKKRGIRQNNNFGGPKTAVAHPAPTTHHSLKPDQLKDQGITRGLVRISAGIEDTALILEIFEAALRAAHARPLRRLQQEPGTLAA